MIALDEIQQMPLHEKLFVMETLWSELSRQAEQVEVPEWHKTLLDEREALIQAGKAQLLDWEEAKRQIREAIS